MNARLFKCVWASYPSGGANRMLMLAVGSSSDCDGRCTLDWDEITAATRMSRNTALRALEKLQASGWLCFERVVRRPGVLSIQLDLLRLETGLHLSSAPESNLESVKTSPNAHKNRVVVPRGQKVRPAKANSLPVVPIRMEKLPVAETYSRRPAASLAVPRRLTRVSDGEGFRRKKPLW